MTLYPDERDESREERTPRASLVGQVMIFVAVLATVIIAISPTPYIVERPGPVFDTLGVTTVEGDEVPVIEVDGRPSYDTEGRLDLLTVYLDGSRERPLDWFSIIRAWFDPTRAILPVDSVFPAGQTDEEADEESALDMRLSQESAIAAALSQLGIPYETEIVVADVTPDAPADGVLKAGDVIVEIGGERITDDATLRAAIREGGVGTPLAFLIRRDGTEREVVIEPVARSAEDPTPVVGVLPTVDFSFPFEVTINLQSVGGPSAGMIFALGIYDTLTPGALTGGEHIAGTGTVDGEGAIGAIGGIRQKMIGAAEAGADWFLAPASNCTEVVGNVPHGLEVFAVATLSDAVEVVAAIGAGEPTDGFARCG